MASILVLRGVRAARARGAFAITAASMLAWLNTADAQQSTPAAGNTLEEVVVTGIRHSIETSIATKRDSTSIVEVVSAEDIGKLPDTSIADSLARLPGLAVQRIDGRPAAISIRGLGEDYAGALLNGRQVVSSSEGRSAEYDQFPSELVNQVIVYKTVDAGVVGQGLSGTIDIRPLMPLSVDRRLISLSARAEQNGNGSLSSTGKGDRGYRFSASYVNQFADDKIGLAVGYAHLDSPGQAKKYGAWAFGDYNGQWGANAGGVPLADGSGLCDVSATRPATQDCAVFQQGFESSATSSKQARDGALAVVEFRPNDRFSSVVDLYYSKFEQDRVGHHWVGDIGLWSGGAQFSNVGTKVVDGNTIIDSGTVSGSQSLVYDKNWDRGDKIRSIGWRNTLEFSDQWTGTLDVGYSRADRDETYIQSVAKANALSQLSFSNSGEPDHTSWSTPQDLTDPNVVMLTNDPNWAEMRTPKFKDEIKSAQLSVNRSLGWGWFDSLDAGVAYNQRDKNVSSDAFLLTLTDAAAQGVPFQAIPADALRGPVTIDVAGIHQNVLSWNVPSIMGLYTITPKDPWLAQTNKFDVHEKVKTAFLKLNIDSPLGTMRVHGNVGVQFVDTEQNSDGFAWNDSGSGGPDGGAVLPVSGGATYSDVLPSLNLVVELQEDLILRFGLGKTMARPRMDDMRAGADQPALTEILSNPGFGTWSASGGGNPEIKPWRAKSVDLALEKYFQARSYVAIGGFLKKLDTFIYERTTTRDFSGFTNYNPDLVPGCELSQPDCDPNIGTFTTQNNGSGGKVYGLEAAASLDAGLLTPTLDGFGVFLSTANTKNSLPKDEEGNEINLDGFSSTVTSLGAYYERGGFSARVSRYHRSAFTATTRSVLLGTLRSTRIDAESQMDAQISYAFDSGMFEGLTLLLQGNNLTNERAITRQSPEVVGGVGQSDGLLPWVDDNYGRVLLLGASYKF